MVRLQSVDKTSEKYVWIKLVVKPHSWSTDQRFLDRLHQLRKVRHANTEKERRQNYLLTQIKVHHRNPLMTNLQMKVKLKANSGHVPPG